MGTNVFLSYGKADEALANHVAVGLAAAGIRAETFVPTAGIDLSNKLRDLLQESDAVVVVLSGGASSNGWLMAELGAARALDKRIVAIHSDTMPLPFSLSETSVIEAAQLSPDDVARTVVAHLAA